MSAFIDITGNVCGELKVVSHIGKYVYPSGQKHSLWKCLCSCGNQCEAVTGNLKSGQTVACLACSAIVRSQKLQKPHQHAKCVMRAYRHGAETRGLSFDLSLEEVTRLVSGNCVYCGDAPKFVIQKRKPSDSIPVCGIDRVDSNIGYCISNCVSCCSICNRAKSNMPASDFISWIKRMAKFNEHR